MKKLTNHQQEVLKLILDETRTNGFPPSYARLKELTGVRNVHALCDRIIERGWLRQPYEGGPYIPTRDLDGTPLRLVLERGEG